MKDVADFVADLTGEENLIARRLRNIILATDPRLQEKLSYGVPYFLSASEDLLSLALLSFTCELFFPTERST